MVHTPHAVVPRTTACGCSCIQPPSRASLPAAFASAGGYVVLFHGGAWIDGIRRAQPVPVSLMTRSFPRLLALPIVLALAGCAAAATPPSAARSVAVAADTAGALAAHQHWWRAFTFADTTHLQASTAPLFSLTLSNGQVMDRAGMIARAATHVNGSGMRIDWAEEAVRVPGPGVAVVTSRVTEGDGRRGGVYRYLTVLQRDGNGWRAFAAQSSREAAVTPRIAAAEAGPLGPYAGEYRTPRGGVVRVVVRDSALGLVAPGGTEERMEPIGPGVFEYSSPQSINNIVRFVFVRDESGRVASLVRIAPGEANTWTRVP